MKENSLYLKEDLDNLITSRIKEELNVKKAASYFQMAITFNRPKLAKYILRLIEGCFTTVCKTDSFFNLNFASVSKILASDELCITSELEVYNASCAWADYKTNERKQFLKEILLKIRLPLFSDDLCLALQNNPSELLLLSKVGKIEEYLSVLKEILRDKEKFCK